ncbi:MAG: methyltransferase [Thermodesulfobacteriota bacterium]
MAREQGSPGDMDTSRQELWQRFFENQIWQVLLLAAVFASALFGYDFIAVPHGQWLGLSTRQWFLIVIITPVVHQFYIWLCWRGELYFKALSRIFGDHAYSVFSIIFLLLIGIRFFSIFAVCVADYQSLSMPFVTRLIAAFILHLPAMYAMYSVLQYFGFERIPGEDHFAPEKYRNKPFVQQGMYKYSANVMYVYAGLIFWAAAILCGSKAGLIASAYMYATVWTHYFCTEKPDIKYIYSSTL